MIIVKVSGDKAVLINIYRQRQCSSIESWSWNSMFRVIIVMILMWLTGETLFNNRTCLVL